MFIITKLELSLHVASSASTFTWACIMIPQYTGINWVSSQEVEGMDLASIWNIDLGKLGLVLVLKQCEQALCISGQKNNDMSLVLNSLILFGNAILLKSWLTLCIHIKLLSQTFSRLLCFIQAHHLHSRKIVTGVSYK